MCFFFINNISWWTFTILLKPLRREKVIPSQSGIGKSVSYCRVKQLFLDNWLAKLLASKIDCTFLATSHNHKLFVLFNDPHTHTSIHQWAGVLVLRLLLLCSFWLMNSISYLSLGPLHSLPPSLFTYDASQVPPHLTAPNPPLSVRQGPWLLRGPGSATVAKRSSPLG